MGVVIRYGNRIISELTSSGTRTIKTGGKFVAEDIIVSYDEQYVPVGGEETPDASYGGTILADPLGAIAAYIGYKPESLTITAGGKTATFGNLKNVPSGTFLGMWNGGSQYYTSIDAFNGAFPWEEKGVQYVAVTISDYGFHAEIGYTDAGWANYRTLEEGTAVTWSAAVNTSQKKVVPSVAAGFIRADGNRLRDGSGNLFVCRAINARLNLILGGSEAEEQRNATWELSEAAYDEIKALKFNTVKLLWSAHFFEQESKPYTYRQAAWDWIDQNIAWAKKKGMKIMLNCHRGQGGAQYSGDGVQFWKNEEYQNRLYALWKAIAQRYRNEPTIVGYGIFNEPWVDDSGNEGYSCVIANKFSAVTQKIIDAIRSVDTNHVIFADTALGVYNATGSYTGNLYRSYWQTPLVNDHNLCIEWHDYYPHNFTVQNQNVSGKTLEYPGTLYSTGGGTTDKAWQRNFMNRLTGKINTVYRREMPIFIGEWGGGGIRVADTDSVKRGMFEDCFNDKMALYNELGYGYGWHLWTGESMGYYPVNPTSAYTIKPKRSWLTAVFQTGNETAQGEG